MALVTLTFDNGPDPVTTDAVLGALGDRGLKALFFVVGDRLRRPGGREMAARAKADGHLLGNHSMTHRVPLGESLDPHHVEREIVAAEELLGDLAQPVKLFRPFGGGGRIGPHLLSPAAAAHLIEQEYTVVLWNSVPGDWRDPSGWVGRARSDVASQPWTVVVLHDLPTGAMAHLPGFLDGLLADGVDFTLDLPDDCVPVRGGVQQWPFAQLTGPETPAFELPSKP